MRKYTIEEVKDIIRCEGLGYAIQSYLGYENIEDPILAEYWKLAEETLSKINEILREK